MPFWDKCTGWPQNDLEHYKVKDAQYTYDDPGLPNFNPFHSTASHFQHVQVTGHFDTSALNDPTMTLNTKRSVTSYVYDNYPQLLNFIPYFAMFAPQPAVFELQTILRQVHRMNSQWPWTLKDTRIWQLILTAQISFHFTLRPTIFELYRAFWDQCTKWPQNDLE